jgi:hypothetical protein
VNITTLSQLTEDDKNAVWIFLKQFDYIPYQQFPEYAEVENLSCKYFIAKDHSGVITGWVQVIEKRNLLAVIEFGPLATNAETVKNLFLFILRHYKKKYFLLTRWVPYCYDPSAYEMIGDSIKNHFRFVNSPNLIHWSSKRIALPDEADIIFKKFSENHRRNIKKAAGLQIECRKIGSKIELNTFIQGYITMYQHRKLKVDPIAIHNSFSRLFQYLAESKKGFFIGAFKGKDLLGGLVIIFQGKTAFYYKGYIDHEQRKMPINHIAFYNAILLAKEENMNWFDFGGYALGTTDEQLININKFKDGFKGEFVEFPKTRMIGLSFISRWIHSLLSLKLILTR